MRKPLLISLAALIASAVPALAQNATIATCDGKEPVGYLGISGIDCNCTLGAPGSTDSWNFRTEPKITSLEMDSPAGRLLKTGDVITHVNNKLITTAEGAQELARLRPGESIVLTVRRNGQSLQYALKAQSACPTDTRLLGIYAPSVSADAAPTARPRGAAPRAGAPTPLPPVNVYGVAPKATRSTPRASFGMGLSCSGNCTMTIHEHKNKTLMHFSTPPEVYSIERGGAADKAGMRRGDVIVKIDGNDVTTTDAGLVFASAKAGQRVAFTVLRNGERKTFTLVATERGTPMPQLAQSSASLEKARAGLADLQREQAEQIRRIEAELRDSRRVEEEKLRELQRSLLRQQQESREKLAQLNSELISAQRRMQAAMTDSARQSCVAMTPLPPGATGLSRTLRYTGNINDTEIEVRGSYPVSVTEKGDEIEITAGGTVVKLKSGRK